MTNPIRLIGVMRLLAMIVLGAAACRTYADALVTIDDTSAERVEVRRGEERAAPEHVGGKAVHRIYAPDKGTWDQVQLYFSRAFTLDGAHPTVSMHVNIVPKTPDAKPRIRLVQLLVDDVGNMDYGADRSMYHVDGVAQPTSQFVNFDNDPNTWQQLTLDLGSGPALQPSHRIVRLAVQFTDDCEYSFAGVRFASGTSRASSNETAKSDAKVQQRPGDGAWPWVSANSKRVMVQCEPYPGNSSYRPAWASVDMVGMTTTGELPMYGWNPDSVRVIEYDPQTHQPIKQHEGDGDAAYFVQRKVERWPMRAMPYVATADRRPIQVSWLRRADGPDRPVYGIYFDARGQGETEPVVEPAFVGTGDALAFGGDIQPSPARGIPIVIDWNGDGLKDLLGVLHTLPDSGIYLYLNEGEKGTPDLADTVFLRHPNIRLVPQVDDIDGDGKLDIGGVGGFFSDVEHKQLSDWVEVTTPEAFDFKNVIPDHRTENWSYHDMDGDGVRDLIVAVGLWHEYGWANAYNDDGQWTRGPLYAWFYVFKNLGTNRNFVLDRPYRLMTTDGGAVNVYGNPTPVMCDLDHDGDLDLLTGDFLGGLFIFENIATSEGHPVFAPPVSVQTTAGAYTALRQANSPVITDWDDDGDIDILLRNEAAQITLLENTGKTAGNTAMPLFSPERDILSRNSRINVGQLPANDLHDYDGDGDLDLIYGDSSGFMGWFENTGSPTHMRFSPGKKFTLDSGEPIRIIAGPNGSIQGPAEALWGYTVPDAADWDGDGDVDILFNSIWGLIQWCPNPNGSNRTVLDAPTDVQVAWTGAPPKPIWRWWNPKPGQWSTQWRATVRMIDWNGDGLLDVVTLDTEGYLVLHRRFQESGQLKLGPPERFFLGADDKPLRVNAEKPGGSGRIKFDLADWDGDGDRDYIQVTPTHTDRGNVIYFENTGSDASPRLVNRGDVADVVLRSHTCAPSIFDYDGDGRLDLIIGAEDGHFYAFNRDYLDDKTRLEAKPMQ